MIMATRFLSGFQSAYIAVGHVVAGTFTRSRYLQHCLDKAVITWWKKTSVFYLSAAMMPQN